MAEGGSQSVCYPPGFNASTRRGSGGFDRFIPHRPSLKLDSAHHQLLHGLQSLSSSSPASFTPFSSPFTPPAVGSGARSTAFPFNVLNPSNEDNIANSSNTDVFSSPAGSSPGGWEYKRRLSAALADDLRPQGGGAGCGRILPLSCSTPFFPRRGSDPWLGSPKADFGLGSPSPTPRRIRAEPDKVLLLSLRNDFYCSLVDWGKNNAIALGVDKGAYVWHSESGDCQHLTPSLRGAAAGGGGVEGEGREEPVPRSGHVSSVKWNNSGTQLALGYSQGLVLIWDAGGMRVGQEFSVPRHAQVDCLAWHSHHLYCGTGSGRVYRFDLREKTPQPEECPSTHRGDACSIQVSPDESMLASGGNDGVVNVWDPRASVVSERIQAHVSGAKALAWCPWRRSVLATGGGASDGHIRIWKVTGQAMKTEVNTQMQVCSVVWSEAYRELVSSHSTTDKYEVVVWSARDLTLSLLARLAPPAGRPLYQCLSPDATTLASASSDERLRLWNLFPKKKRPVSSTSLLNMDRLIR